jgi:hypothetical protein
MANYCDSANLEKTWYLWILGSSYPDLEQYRLHNLLYTRPTSPAMVDGKVVKKYGKPLLDPRSVYKDHCIALPVPIYFKSRNNVLTGKIRVGNIASNKTTRLDERMFSLDIQEYSGILKDNIFIQSQSIIPKLLSDGFIKEQPTTVSWHNLLSDIGKMCSGICKKFNLYNEDEYSDLSNDALLQVINKLVNNRLVYTPGRAPVFNLLTTTIHRCMFSLLNKKNSQKAGLNKLLSDSQHNLVPKINRSLKTLTHNPRK